MVLPHCLHHILSISSYSNMYLVPSVLWCCWLGIRKSICPVKTDVYLGYCHHIQIKEIWEQNLSTANNVSVFYSKIKGYGQHETNSRPSTVSSNSVSLPLWMDDVSVPFKAIFCTRCSISLSLASSSNCKLLTFCVSSFNSACSSLCCCCSWAENWFTFSRSCTS